MSLPLSKFKKKSVKELKTGDVMYNERQGTFWIYLQDKFRKENHWCPHVTEDGITSLFPNALESTSGNEKYTILFNVKDLVDKLRDEKN